MAVKYHIRKGSGDPGSEFYTGSGWSTDSDDAQLYDTQGEANAAIPDDAKKVARVGTTILVKKTD